MSKGRRHIWSPAEIAVLRRLYADTPTKTIALYLGRPLQRVHSKAGALGLKKSAEYLASAAACRLRRGDNVGAGTRFKPGHVPFNKGKKGWDAGGRSHETRFKAGQRGNKWVPVGTERINADGYRDRKIADTGYPPRDWRALHLLLWEERHGLLPPGYALCFIDGDKSNVVLENLVLLTRSELMARNTIARFPPELRHVIRLNRKLQRAIEGRADEKQD